MTTNRRPIPIPIEPVYRAFAELQREHDANSRENARLTSALTELEEQYADISDDLHYIVGKGAEDRRILTLQLAVKELELKKLKDQLSLTLEDSKLDANPHISSDAQSVQEGPSAHEPEGKSEITQGSEILLTDAEEVWANCSICETYSDNADILECDHMVCYNCMIIWRELTDDAFPAAKEDCPRCCLPAPDSSTAASPQY